MRSLSGLGRLMLALLVLACGAALAAPVTGYIYTTRYYSTAGACNGAHIAYFTNKLHVGLLGGAPYYGGAAILPGQYAVFVTDEKGYLLGKTNGKTFTVGTTGKIPCTQLANIVFSRSSSYGTKGFNTSASGIYKVWLSNTDRFPPSAAQSITTMFKIPSPDTTGAGLLCVGKVYDTNANGCGDEVGSGCNGGCSGGGSGTSYSDGGWGDPTMTYAAAPNGGSCDGSCGGHFGCPCKGGCPCHYTGAPCNKGCKHGECADAPPYCLLFGWKATIRDAEGFMLEVFTPRCVAVAPGYYMVTESLPLESNWRPTSALAIGSGCITCADATTATCVGVAANRLSLVIFGNVCLDGCGAHLPCQWCSGSLRTQLGNSPGAATMLRGLYLRTETGSRYCPPSSNDFCCWLNNAQNGRNIAYVLSAYLASLKLDIYFGYVDPNTLVYAPETQYANEAGFVKLGLLLQEVNAELCAHGCVPHNSPHAAYQKYLRNILDQITRNRACVNPCVCNTSTAERTSLGSCSSLPGKCDFSFLK